MGFDPNASITFSFLASFSFVLGIEPCNIFAIDENSQKRIGKDWENKGLSDPAAVLPTTVAARSCRRVGIRLIVRMKGVTAPCYRERLNCTSNSDACSFWLDEFCAVASECVKNWTGGHG